MFYTNKIVLFLQSVINTLLVKGYNLAPEAALIYSAPHLPDGIEGAYFGYSIGVMRTQNSFK